MCNETKFILLRLKTSKDIFKTELLKIYKIVTNTKGTLSIRRRRKKTKKQKETLQNVSNNNVTRTKILKTKSLQKNNRYDIIRKALQNLSKLL